MGLSCARVRYQDLPREESVIREPKQAHFVEHESDECMTAVSALASDHSGSVEPQRISSDPGPTSKRRGRQQLPNNKNAFRCIDCSNEVTFSRKSDLRRHQRSQHSHESVKPFVCNAQGCFRKQLPWSFARSDKLTSHIKAEHKSDTIFSICSISGCSFGPCTLEVLGVHIRHLHPDHEYGRAILNATSCKTLRCPLWQCGKNVTAKKLSGHVSGHSAEEVQADLLNVRSEGLVVEFAPTDKYASSAKSSMTIRVLCPVCNKANDNVEHFVDHLWADHLFAVGGAEHFNAWKADWASKVHSLSRSAILKCLPWGRPAPWSALGNKYDFRCPSCPFIVSDSVYPRYGRFEQITRERDAISSHHLSLLRPESVVVKELYPYRMQILRFYPEFVSHPVFDDFKQPQSQQQSQSNPSEAQLTSSDLMNNDFEMPHWTPDDFNSYV